MDVVKKVDGDKTLFELTGRLDTTTAPDFQTTLVAEFASAKSVTLDFAGLVYVSSAGLRALLMGQKTAKSHGATMTLKNVAPAIMEVFNMTGFAGILTIE